MEWGEATPREPPAHTDEHRCHACGGPITDGVCTQCGTPTTIPEAAQLSNPSHRSYWWVGIATSLIAWWILIIHAGAGQPGIGYLGATGTLQQLLNGVVWIMMPIAGYLDIQYVRATSDWHPNTTIWLIAMTIWLINLIAAAAYLYRRHEAIGIP